MLRLNFQVLLRCTLFGNLVMVSTLDHSHTCTCFADTFQLKNGTLLQGTCLNATDKNATEWQFETQDGLQLTLSRSDVKDFRPTSDEQKLYADQLAKKDDSLEVHRKFVEACLTLKLVSLADAHRERIVELDPSDKTAWGALGYMETSEGWIRRDLYQRRRGLQKKGTRYYLPQDLAIEQANEQAKQQGALMAKKISKALSDVRSNSAKAADSRQYLAQLKDPMAVPELNKVLKKERSSNNPQFRLQIIEILGRIRSVLSVKALIDSSLNDPDSNVRAECVSKLSEYGRELAIQSWLLVLTNIHPETDKPELYNRVGGALTELGDERCIQRLIDCLVTDHLIVPPPLPSYRAGQTSDGNMQFSPSAAKPEKVKTKNDGVLAALQNVSQGENFGFDVQAWRNWYAKTYAAPNPFVLRDP